MPEDHLTPKQELELLIEDSLALMSVCNTLWLAQIDLMFRAFTLSH